MRPNWAGSWPSGLLPIISLPTTHPGSLNMTGPLRTTCMLFVLSVLTGSVRGDDQPKPAGNEASFVYGEWRIRVRPDQEQAYDALIEKSGLPLFRQAGGRMVGWWKTLIGDLYEHVTIWEYDDMAAFEKAVGFLAKSSEFAKFVASRDPLLSGEESRFLRLASGATRPRLPEPAPFVVHEIHKVPLAHREAYLAYMTTQGLGLLKANGFRPAGPWIVEVGKGSEVTYLHAYESLAERERRIARFSSNPSAREYRQKLGELTEDISSRLLIPAAFARAPAPATGEKTSASGPELPHREEIAPGVHVAGFADRYHSSNCGWVALEDEALLIDLPRGIEVAEFLKLVAATTGKPAKTLVLTHTQDGDRPILLSLRERGITRVMTSPAIRTALIEGPHALDPGALRALGDRTAIGDASTAVEFVPMDDVAGHAGGAVYLSGKRVLFAGPLVVHGPRAALARIDTARWADALRRLEKLDLARVIPGIGTWGGPELLARQRKFLTELRRQVGYEIAQGHAHAGLTERICLPTDCLVWTPYGNATGEDIEHVYNELTVPSAPFQGREPTRSESRPHALVLIGDQPHEPGHLEEGLRPVFEATGVIPHFTVDVRSLSAQNLAKVGLLVMLRDGLQRPSADTRSYFKWMTPDQERAVVAFVEDGGGFLNLHNSMGLSPEHGPYLALVGGRYIGHGPLERFRVEVVDSDHPVTRGVSGFFTADEQHTPPYDEGRVHLLLRNRSDGGNSAAAGWVREPGRGRLCHLANGHTLEALLHPMYQRLMCNAVRWCLRMDGAGR
jgi:Trehalose utilisation/NIPSNAP